MTDATKSTADWVDKMQEEPELHRVSLLSGDTVKIEPVSWLWSGWLARGKMEIIAGPPGTGKTTIALALASTVSSGGKWPDQTLASHGRVVIWSGEDDPSDTLAPRLIAMGADMSRISFVTGTVDENGKRPFDPAEDTLALCDALASNGADLLIIDPVVSAVAGDSHKNSETRRALQPLVDLAHGLDCCVLGISHFAKGTAGRNPVDRVAGSLAFGALARVVLAAVKLPEKSEEGHARLFCRVKSNIGPDGGGFGYDIEQVTLDQYPDVQASLVQWAGPVDGAAHELLAMGDQIEADDERSNAEQFLLEELKDGPVPVKELKKLAADAGISWRTLNYHKKRACVNSRKSSFSSGWIWYIEGLDITEENEDTAKMPTPKPLHPSPPSSENLVSRTENMPNTTKNAKSAKSSALGSSDDDDGELRI